MMQAPQAPQRVGRLVENRAVYTLSPDMTVAQAAAYMAERRVGAVSVVENERLAGLFSERDLLKRVVAAGRDPRATRVSEVMSSPVLTADAEEPPGACLERMKKANIRHLAVLSQGRLMGLVTLRDLLLADITEKQGELTLMRAYIDYAPPEGGG